MIGSTGRGNADKVHSLNCGLWVPLLRNRNLPTTSSHLHLPFSGRGAVRVSEASAVTLATLESEGLEDPRSGKDSTGISDSD